MLRQRPCQRGTAGEVDVIADQHRLPDRVVRIDTARRVGQHDGAAACRDGGADPVHHGVRVVPLVKMNSSEVQQDAELALSHISNGRCVPHYRRLLKSAQIFGGAFGFWRADRVCRGQPARAEHHGGVKAIRSGDHLQRGGTGRRAGKGVRCQGGG
jgi:hypothetical protein